MAPLRPRALMLTPGAGSSADHPCLLEIDKKVSALGLFVSRIDFPYRVAGRKFPDRAPVLVDAVRKGATALSKRHDIELSSVLVGGRSMGGRMCSMAVAEGLPTAGLVLVSYPLHPPGRAGQRRIDHFPEIGAPCLFISGDRDPFASPKELLEAMNLIPTDVTHHFIARGDHGLRHHDELIATMVADWVEGLREI